MIGKPGLQGYMQQHVSLYIYVSVLLLMGVIFGALLFNSLSLEQKKELTEFLSGFMQTIDQEAGLQSNEDLRQTFTGHLKWLLLIWLLGLSVIGMPLILVLDFLKGIVLGFTMGYLVGHLSWKGLLFGLVSVAPQNIILVPVMIICSVSGIIFSSYLIKHRLLKHNGKPLSEPFIRYTLLMLIFVAILFGISVFETYVTPLAMKWAAPLFMN